jgi:hypothetical protein
MKFREQEFQGTDIAGNRRTMEQEPLQGKHFGEQLKYTDNPKER